MAVKRYDGSQWVTVAGKGDQGTSSSIATWVKTVSGGETSLSGNDDNSQALSYTVGQELVFINGTLLKRGSDYTATDGTTITGLSALAANDVATVWTVTAFSVTNAISNTLVDAKGDLVTASGADVPARLAVGNNGETLVADSSASTGLRWQGNYAAGKNAILNGAFNIWQRGTSFTTPALNAYTADRFYQAQDGTAPTITHSQQTFTPGTAPVSGYESQFFYRIDQTVAGSAATFNLVGQKIEDVRTFAGQTMTFSFWAKAAATITLPSIAISQVFGSGGSGSVNTTFTGATNVSVGTSWTRYSYTVSVPSISGKTVGAGSHLIVRIFLPLNSTFTFDTWGWQVEGGSVATAFQTATGTLAGELAACQRYYYRLAPAASGRMMAVGQAYGTTSAGLIFYFPVEMRTRPTAIEQSGTAAHYKVIRANSADEALSAVPTYDAGTTTRTASINATVAANLVAGNATTMWTNNADAYLGWSAEL